MRFIDRIKRAIRAFKEDERKPERRPPPAEFFDLIDEIQDKKMTNPVDIFNLKARATEIAKKACDEQNKQIDGYFDRVVAKNVDPVIIQLYEGDNQRIPGLATEIAMFIDPKSSDFGRRVMIKLNGKRIGDAVFTAKFRDGSVSLSVEERIPA